MASSAFCFVSGIFNIMRSSGISTEYVNEAKQRIEPYRNNASAVLRDDRPTQNEVEWAKGTGEGGNGYKVTWLLLASEIFSNEFTLNGSMTARPDRIDKLAEEGRLTEALSGRRNADVEAVLDALDDVADRRSTLLGKLLSTGGWMSRKKRVDAESSMLNEVLAKMASADDGSASAAMRLADIVFRAMGTVARHGCDSALGQAANRVAFACMLAAALHLEFSGDEIPRHYISKFRLGDSAGEELLSITRTGTSLRLDCDELPAAKKIGWQIEDLAFLDSLDGFTAQNAYVVGRSDPMPFGKTVTVGRNPVEGGSDSSFTLVDDTLVFRRRFPDSPVSNAHLKVSASLEKGGSPAFLIKDMSTNGTMVMGRSEVETSSPAPIEILFGGGTARVGVGQIVVMPAFADASEGRVVEAPVSQVRAVRFVVVKL